MNDRETVVEVGFALLTACLLAALAILLGGRASGAQQRSRQHSTLPPSAGSVPAERQQARGVVSAR